MDIRTMILRHNEINIEFHSQYQGWGKYLSRYGQYHVKSQDMHDLNLLSMQ